MKEFDVHEFVKSELAKQGLGIELISEPFMKQNFLAIKSFVNKIRLEYEGQYGWKEEDEAYFMNGLVDKWKYSFVIHDSQDQICFLNFTSVYGEILHNHCTYADSRHRGNNLAKYHMLKLCQVGIDNGFIWQDGYWPKHNNGSLILFLRMGWKIEDMKKENQIRMLANMPIVKERVSNLLKNE